MFLIKLIAAAFLISINIFTFLLIKFQKSDRDLNVLKSVASGDADKIDYKQTPDPNKKEVKQANSILVSEKNSDDEEKTDNTQKYSHVYDNSSSNNSNKQNEDEDEDDDDDEDFPDKKPAPLSKKEKKKQQKKLVVKYGKKPVSDIKLLLCALLGGSLGIYLALFIFKYRLRDIIMMVLIPTFLVINIYVYYHIFAVWLFIPLAGTVQLINYR